MANQIKLILKNILTQPNLWAGVIPMHLLGMYAIYNFANAPAFWWVASIIGYICIMMLGISACYHRLLSHRGFQVHRVTKIFMMWCATLGGQGSPIFWVTIHRGYHHRLSDKPGDPHSPNDGFWHAYILWMFKITEQDVNPKYAIDILKRLYLQGYTEPTVQVGLAIEDSLKKIFDKVMVINSDDNNTRDGWIDLGDSAYFTSQFTKALELFNHNKKVLLHVQGDTEYGNWKQLVDDARKYYNLYEWGVYAPEVTNVWYTPDQTDIDGLQSDDSNIKMVACTDETVWFIHRDVISDFYNRNLSEVMTPETMKMGWGWDLVMNAISFIMQRPVIRDYSHQIQHAQGTNYNKETAGQEMANLWSNLPNDLKECISYIKGDREKIVKYFE